MVVAIDFAKRNGHDLDVGGARAVALVSDKNGGWDVRARGLYR
jgi:hypothetical protein